MIFHSFLIKYGEIGIKGKNRYLFEDALVRQMRFALKGVDGDFYVHKAQGRVYVECEGEYDYEETIESLKRVFGIVGICPVVRVEDRGFEQLSKDVISYMEEMYPDGNQTFKVEARRSRKQYPMTSMEINCELGGVILDAFPGMKVDVHNPDIRLNVEVREEIYLYSEIIPGPGGMPVGTNGSAMLLLSGGIDSPVAGYMWGCMPPISMHRRIPARGQKKRWLIWPDWFPGTQGRFSCTLLISRISSSISMKNARMRSLPLLCADI